jgi:hypothetical protein
VSLKQEQTGSQLIQIKSLWITPQKVGMPGQNTKAPYDQAMIDCKLGPELRGRLHTAFSNMASRMRNHA